MKTKLIAFWQRLLNWIKRNKKKSAIGFVLLVVYYFSLPRVLFEEPYATVIESSDGELLAAKIARDGQWRFPAQDSVPDKFKKCIVYFEDEHFYYHPGFNPVAMGKAFQQNRSAGKVVRGGSTLTQQRKNHRIVCGSCALWWQCSRFRNGFMAVFRSAILSIVLGRKRDFGGITQCAKFDLSRKKPNQIDA